MPINFSAHSTQSGADNWYDISAWGWFKKKDQHEGRKKVIVFHEDKTSNDYLNIFLTDIPNETIKLNQEVDSISLHSEEM